MPAAVLANKVTACHKCKNEQVPVTTTGLLRRHKNTRGYVCSASNTPKENRVRTTRR